jgi:hypothetical protein
MRAWPPTISSAENEYARSVGFASGAERREAIRRDDERKWRREQQRIADIGRFEQPAADTGREAALRENGVTAREFDPDALRAGRIALGLEPDPIPPAQAAE